MCCAYQVAEGGAALDGSGGTRRVPQGRIITKGNLFESTLWMRGSKDALGWCIIVVAMTGRRCLENIYKEDAFHTPR